MKVVCIAGMHRSGTSMVARLLNLSGVYLGEEKDLLPPQPDNLEGFWENRHFMKINDEILSELNAGWDYPPKADSGWEKTDVIYQSITKASELMQQFSTHKIWGWKDPRNSLTFPFWREIIPSIKVVICIRNPLEVANSLMARNYFSPALAYNLWYEYNQRILSFTKPESHIITHYDSYFHDPVSELTRILEFLEIKVLEKQLVESIRTVSIPSRHNKSTLLDLMKSAPSEVIDLYQKMCTQSGLVYEHSSGFNAEVSRSVNLNLSGKENAKEMTRLLSLEILSKNQMIRDKEQSIQDLMAQVAEKDQSIQGLTAQIAEKEMSEQGLMSELGQKEASYQNLSAQLIEKEVSLQALSEQLQEITISKAWKFALWLRNIRITLLPPNSAVPTRPEIQNEKRLTTEQEMNFTTGEIDSPAYLALSRRREKVNPNDPGILKDPSKLIAFYLPQFHEVQENSIWWGPGFTEWTNTAKATPNFQGHYQPHIPRELGFYDLSHVETIKKQVEFARHYGIYGFCFYYYWFSGRRILERPVDNFMASDIDFPFCLCWANENWTRTWDGLENNILLKQKYDNGNDERFIKSLLPFFTDSRYIKVDNKPLLLIYRIKELPRPNESITKWRNIAKEAGFPDLHISVVDFYDISDPREVGADALVEFPPHKFSGPHNHPQQFPNITNAEFTGGILDYRSIIAQSAHRNPPDFLFYRGIMPGWDNTPRRQNTPTIVINNTPDLYGIWLRYLRSYNRIIHSNTTDTFSFINAWNEWGEGCHLEPDLRWGTQFLEETARSGWYDGLATPSNLDEARERLLNELTGTQNQKESSPKELIHQQKVMKFNNQRPAPNPIVAKISWTLRNYPTLRRVLGTIYRLGKGIS